MKIFWTVFEKFEIFMKRSREKKRHDWISSRNFFPTPKNCRKRVPKNLKGVTLWDFLTSIVLLVGLKHDTCFSLKCKQKRTMVPRNHPHINVAFGSQRFTGGQLSLTMYAKEFLAMDFAFDEIAHICWSVKIPKIVITKQIILFRNRFPANF